MFCCKKFCRQYDGVSANMFTFQQGSATAHRARDTTVLQTSLLQTCGHLTHRTSTQLTMPSGQSCSSVCFRPKSMTLTSCDSVNTVWCGLEQRAVDDCHWSVATSSVSLCRHRRRTFWTKPRPINFSWEFYISILMLYANISVLMWKSAVFWFCTVCVLIHAW